MRRNFNGFTLSEIMITLAILGVLAAILIPVINSNRPDRNKSLFRKAYYVAERMVYEIVNDDDLYPTKAGTVGLDNTDEITYLNTEYGSNNSENAQKSKFCQIFARKVNTISDSVNCTADNTTFDKTPSFITTDGIAWYMPFSDFPQDEAQTIRVDINGETEPNCTFSADCPNPDRFEIKLRADGKMFVEGEKEKEYLNSINISKSKGYNM